MTNEELDRAVLKEIKRVPQTFKHLRVNLKEYFPGKDLYRPVDHALQRLRKAGKIRYVKSRWRPT